MPIRILFEIGHKAVRKAKPLDAFTHDWELFVRGTDGKEMNKYVEKIVFNLHESFPNPIRTQRDPPYILREAGYGGFLLPIDIHFKAGPRDEPKSLSITYDLDITKPQHVVKYNHTFMNPSTEFRYRLVEGGGILINSDGHEDRPQSESRSRCQVSSTTVSTGGKKHKTSKAEEGKPLNTFENLFGPPIQNLPAKHSPAMTSTDSHKTQKSSSKDRSSEKSVKEKKDKSKSTSSKDTNNSKESIPKKSSTDEKNERRDDKRKDKSHGKDRDRSKEKPSKRPISPKSESRSPKRSTSPASTSHRTTSSNNSIRPDTKIDDKSVSGSKKSKKEKRDKSKERDRTAATSDHKKENKEIKHQTQTSTKQKDERSAVSNKALEKLNGSGKRDESTGSNTPKDSTARDKLSNSYRTAYDTKPPSPIDVPPQTKPHTPNDTKKSDKHDKDGSERKHKHKKEKKSKDKDKEKERKKDKDKSSKSKELTDELLNVSNHRTTTPTTQQHSNRISSQKPNSTPQSVQVPPPSQRSVTHLSDKSSSDYDMEEDYVTRSTSPPPTKSDINDTNTLMDHAIADVPRSIQSESPKKHADKFVSNNKKEKESKLAQNAMPNKDDKKRKRKTKVEKLKPEPEVPNSSGGGGAVSGGGKRKIQSPLVNDDLSAKYSKKDEERPMPIKKETNKKDSTKMEKISPSITSSNKSAPISTPSSSSSSSESIPSIAHEHRPKSESPPSSDKTYIAQLKALQQKIMTLQDNEELQQVVDMIAATGCYEITRSTFDFDLCALDRTTVQRLQERLG